MLLKRATPGLLSKYSQFWLYNDGILVERVCSKSIDIAYYFPFSSKLFFNYLSRTTASARLELRFSLPLIVRSGEQRWSGVSRRVRVGGGGQDRTIATVESGSSYRSSRCCCALLSRQLFSIFHAIARNWYLLSITLLRSRYVLSRYIFPIVR